MLGGGWVVGYYQKDLVFGSMSSYFLKEYCLNFIDEYVEVIIDILFVFYYVVESDVLQIKLLLIFNLSRFVLC